MKCYRCDNPIPEGATKCHHCFNTTGRTCPTHPFPSADMYGYGIKLFQPDAQRKRARQVYIDGLPEAHQLRINKMEKTKAKNKYALIVMICVIASFIMFGIISSVSYDAAEVMVMLMPIGIIALLVFMLFSAFKQKNGQAVSSFDVEMELHYPKAHYYYNHRTIGFSKFERRYKDKDGNVTEYYHFYEVDKANVKGIYYDSKYAEYVLVLYRPVYMDYALPPKCEFRIPDIFEEAILTNILGSDLPPKNVPF